MTTSSQVIACTLTGENLQGRIDWIARLARDVLRSYERDDLTLRLRYAPDAVDSMRKMVREEQVCCAFLAFESCELCDELLLTISTRGSPRCCRRVVRAFQRRRPGPFSPINAVHSRSPPLDILGTMYGRVHS
jgi:hypothetical protein